jgi:pimeloyl-ACP methyl ester carboxylesterase
VILGGFLGKPSVYEEMREALQIFSGAPVRTVSLSYADWVSAVSKRGWKMILQKLHRLILGAVGPEKEPGVILVGHSAGGVMGRLYLSPDPFEGHRFAGHEHVRHLITLGSPHKNVRGARIRRWVDRTYPGAYYSPSVTYTTVSGRALLGDPRGDVRNRIAFSVYRHLSGLGEQWGDGLVPLSSARLDGAKNLVLEDVGHAPVGGSRWYGTREVVKMWWSQLNL